MPTTPAGDYLYYRDLTDANATALGSFVCRLDLSASSFDFSKVRSDGADLAVYDMTGGAAVPYWLEDFDATARRARLYFKATNTGNAHRLYYGNPAGVSASNFTAVFTKGTGFDSGWGDLSTATAGGTQELAVLAASTGVGDPRGRRVWRMKRSPAIPGTTNSPDLGVRNLSIVTDQHGRIVPDGSGNWVGYYGSQPPTTPRRIFRAISSDEGETWTGHTLVLSPDQLYDINGVMPGSVIQISPTSYVMWITSTGSTVDGGPSTGGVGLATAADIMGPWTKAGIVIKANTPLITGYAAESVAIPHVRRMSDGVWTMVCESRASGPVAWKIAGFVASSYSGPWASMNSGNPILVGGATSWGSVGFADPYLIEISPGLYCLFTDGHTGNDTTPGPSWNGFNCQCGFFTSAAYNTSSWTPDPGSPPIGNHLNEYGVHTEPWVIHPTTGEYVNFFTRFDSFDVNNPYGDTYKIHAEKGRGGLVVTRANADGAVVGMPLAAGTFTAESRSWMTTHRSEDADIYVLSLMDSATLPTPDTSTNVAAAGYLRLEIRRTSFASGSPGDIQFRYWDASSTARFLPGGGTVKIAAGSSDTNRDILAAISDDGTNFLLSVVYADDLSPIASGSVAKSAVKAFTHPPFLVIGELYTSSGAGGTFFRHVGVRPYAAVEPAFSPGAEVPLATLPATPGHRLLESGGARLLESGDFRLLEGLSVAVASAHRLLESGGSRLLESGSFRLLEGDIVIPPASAYALSGPTTAVVGFASGPFTISLTGAMGAGVTITPHVAGIAGTFSPASVVIPAGSVSGTFAFTPSGPGAATISTTNGSSLTDPPALTLIASYTVPPATSYTLDGPTAATVGRPSSPFSVALAGGALGVPVTITPHVAGLAGTFTPAAVVIPAGSFTANFTFTPSAAGTATISTTDNAGLADPASRPLACAVPLPPETFQAAPVVVFRPAPGPGFGRTFVPKRPPVRRVVRRGR